MVGTVAEFVIVLLTASGVELRHVSRRSRLRTWKTLPVTSQTTSSLSKYERETLPEGSIPLALAGPSPISEKFHVEGLAAGVQESKSGFRGEHAGFLAEACPDYYYCRMVRLPPSFERGSRVVISCSIGGVNRELSVAVEEEGQRLPQVLLPLDGK